MFVADFKKQNPEPEFMGVPSVAAALQVTVHDATPADAPKQPSFAAFEQICRKIGAGGEVVDPEHIKYAYKMIEDLDLVTYLERIREMVMFLWVEWSQRKQRGEEEICKCDIKATQVPNELFYNMQGYYLKSNEDVFEQHRHLDCFREAFDGVAMCEFIEEKIRQPLELILSDEGDFRYDLIKILNQEREREGKMGRIVEGWDWTEALRLSAVWKN